MGACGSLGNCRVKLQRRCGEGCATRSARTRRVSRRSAKKDRDIDPLLSFSLSPPLRRSLNIFRDPRLVKSFTYPDPGIPQSLYARKPPTPRDLGLPPPPAALPPLSPGSPEIPGFFAARRAARETPRRPSSAHSSFFSIPLPPPSYPNRYIGITRIAATIRLRRS
jgi:hypothetical protein